MLSDKLLCAKAFDAAGEETGGSHSASGATGRANSGSNFWADSNLRAWLNSSDGAGSVVWPCGNPPITEKMKSQYPGYADEAGFLTNFSMEEKSVMKTVSQKSILSTYDKSESTLGSEAYYVDTSYITERGNYTNAYSHHVIDTVFLLDIMQIRSVFEFNSNYTSCAFTSEAYNYIKSLGYSFAAEGAAYNYWIRTPVASNSISVRYMMSTASNKNSYCNANTVTCGVRPAFFLNSIPEQTINFISPEESADGIGIGFTDIPDEAKDQAYRLTFQDDTRNDFEITDKTKITTNPCRTIELPYSNARTGEDEYISAMIADADGDIVYYGRVFKPSDENGTVSITMPNNIVDGTYTLKLFSEQYTGINQTGYAGDMEDIELEVLPFNITKADNIENGDINITPEKTALNGETITITPIPRQGYEYESITITDAKGNSTKQEATTFAMPAEHITVSAKFVPIPVAVGDINMSGSTVVYGYEAGENTTLKAEVASQIEAYDYAYQWFESVNGSNIGGIKIDGATNPTYEVEAGKNTGEYYYYCEVTATNRDSGESQTKAGNTVTFKVDYLEIPSASITVPEPAIGGVPQTGLIINDEQAKYMSEQLEWYYGSTPIISFVNGSAPTVIITLVPFSNYKFADKAVVSLNGSEVSYTKNTANRSITIRYTFPALSLIAPSVSISVNSVDAGYAEGEGYVNVTVKNIDTEKYSYKYQWYENTKSSYVGGTPIDGATDSEYTVPAGKPIGTYYYYCEVTAVRRSDGYEVTSHTSAASFKVGLKTIETAEVVVIPPAADEAPSEKIGTSSGAAYTVESIEWYNGSKLMTADDKFESGKTYTAKVTLTTGDEYKFEKTTGYINGEKATVAQVNQRKITVSYSFKIPAEIPPTPLPTYTPLPTNTPAPTAKPIKSLEILVTEPKANEAPSSYSAVINSLCVPGNAEWYRADTGVQMSAGEVFEKGKSYIVKLDVKTPGEYKFTSPTVTINGTNADVTVIDDNNIHTECTFAIPSDPAPDPITLVDAMIVSPTEGGTPASRAAMFDQNCSCKLVEWYEVADDGTVSKLTSGATFETGKKYECRLTVTTDARHKFAEPIGSINANTADINRIDDQTITMSYKFDLSAAPSQPTAAPTYTPLPTNTPIATVAPANPTSTPSATLDPTNPTATPGATVDPTNPTSTPIATADPTMPTSTPGATADPTKPTATPGATTDPTTPTSTPGATTDPTKPTATPIATVDPTKPTATPIATTDPTKPTATPGATVDPTNPTSTPIATVDPTMPTSTPSATTDPTKPTATPIATVDPTMPTATPSATVAPTKPTSTPGATTDPTKPTSTPMATVDPTKPTATPVATTDPTKPTATPSATVDPTKPTATPGATTDPTKPTATPGATADPTTPTSTPGATVDPTTPTSTPIATVDPTTPTSTPIATVDPTNPTATPVATTDPTKPTATPGATTDPTTPTSTPGATTDPTNPTSTPIATVDPTMPTATPIATVDPTMPTATPGSTVDPTNPTATPSATIDPTKPTATPSATVDPTKPTATPGATTDPTNPTSTPFATADPTTPTSTPGATVDPTNPTSTPFTTADPTKPTATPGATTDPTKPTSTPNATTDPTTPTSTPGATVDPTNPTATPIATVDPTTPTAEPSNDLNIESSLSALIKKGDKLSTAVLSEIKVTDELGNEINGEFTWETPDEIMSTAGTFDRILIFIPEDEQYQPIEFNVKVTVYTATIGGGGGSNGGYSTGGNSSDVISPSPIPDIPQLNRDEHFAYIIGYPEGDVRPDNNISREEVATIFYRLLTDESRDVFFKQENDFIDVPEDLWSNIAISTMSNAKIVNGDPDGSFRPEEYITRAEFAAIAARFDSSAEVGESKFSDITGHWAEGYINRAAAKAWINGYEDGTFRPDQYITRAEAMTLINNVLNRHVEVEGLLEDMLKFTDNSDENAWYYTAVQEATNSHSYERAENEKNEKWTELVRSSMLLKE